MRDIEEKSVKKKDGFWDNFKQQSLNAWTPRYNSTSVSPLLVGFGIILIPIGVAMLIISTDGSEDIKEKRIDYTDCLSVQNSSMTCAQYLLSRRSSEQKQSYQDDDEPCQCNVEFELPKPIKGKKVYMYYTLTNFYQNARQYVRSRDDSQLLGKLGTYENPYKPNKECRPLDIDKETGKIYFPCGVVANTMFNDTLQLYFNDDVEGEVEIQQIRKGIAWTSDLKYRYKNPPEFYDRNNTIWEKFSSPKDWGKTIWDLDPSDPENNGIQNEDFIVWMRISAFPNFQKLYRIIKPADQDILGDRLPAGKYRLKITYTYDVVSFQGRKGIVLSATTIFGQQNIFQGVATVSVGGISVMLGVLFLLCGCSKRHGKGLFTTPGSD